ncbi:MAG: PA domain-containing protein, partial [Gemmatimonadota bacterium]
MNRAPSRWAGGVLLALATTAPPRALIAQDGFAALRQESQAAFEQALMEVIVPDSVARWARGLSAEPHVAGTPGQVATRDSVLMWFRDAGIEATYDSLVLYLPQPLDASLEQTAPTREVFALDEPGLDDAVHAGVPVFNAYSGNGSAEGAIVYANYGLPVDYAVLDSLGVDVRGRIVLVRYGRSFRGIKAREAEARGAAGLLLYSDPAADGFERGTVLPDGPMRPPTGIQRGSVLNANGDPSTPEGPSLPAAARVPEGRMEGIAGIPVLPIGYGAAGRLLAGLSGRSPGDDWQGGLDIEYRCGARTTPGMQ